MSSSRDRFHPYSEEQKLFGLVRRIYSKERERERMRNSHELSRETESSRVYSSSRSRSFGRKSGERTEVLRARRFDAVMTIDIRKKLEMRRTGDAPRLLLRRENQLLDRTTDEQGVCHFFPSFPFIRYSSIRGAARFCRAPIVTLVRSYRGLFRNIDARAACASAQRESDGGNRQAEMYRNRSYVGAVPKVNRFQRYTQNYSRRCVTNEPRAESRTGDHGESKRWDGKGRGENWTDGIFKRAMKATTRMRRLSPIVSVTKHAKGRE